jgi:uncharacterized protein (DUF302 family)
MSGPNQADHGTAGVASRYSVPETMGKLETLAESGFSVDAQKVGLTMRPARLLIFSNPKAGTPLMIVSGSIAIDLPLKALAWERLRH